MKDTGIVIREAVEADIPALVGIYADDTAGGHGDVAAPDDFSDYLHAFHTISSSPDQTLYVAEKDGIVVGTFQAIIVTTLPGRGTSSMTIAAVHTRGDRRGQGIGAAMMRHAIEEAKRGGLRQVQLMSNAVRLDAHRFYERLGFEKTHAGFKMKLK